MAEPSSSGAPPVNLVCQSPGCGQTFRRRDYLARHEAMHTDVRPYVCDLCSKAFGRSDVLTRHRKKCPAAETQRRSISPYSPTRQHQPISQRPGTRTPQEAPQEYASLLGTLPNIESRLPLIPITAGPSGKRKHGQMAREGQDEESGSDISVESLVLNERTGGGRQGNVRAEGAAGESGGGARTGSKQRRRMPILDVDFPEGTDKEMAAAATTLVSVENQPMRQQGASQNQYYPPPQQAMPPAPSGPSMWSDDSPLDLNWLGDFGMGPGTDGSNFANFEMYLPDTFDFESFLSSTLAENSATQGTNFLTSTVPIQQAQASGFNAETSVPSSVARVMKRIGSPTQADSAYHVPVERFRAYYQMAHWRLPPLTELVSYAEKTRLEVLPHFGFIHLPSLRLDMFATCLAFTLCVVGADLPQQQQTAGSGQADRQEPWDLGPMVRNELTVMIMKSFSVTKQMRMSDYNMALNQSLLLLQSPEILSEHSHERMRANLFRTTIVNTARQLECYNLRSSHFRHEIRIPVQPWTFAELDLHWRRWLQLEVRRRTTYFIFVYDSLATIETSIPCICAPAEVCYIPLPAPSSLWDAPSSETWLNAAKAFKPISLDSALRILFTAPDPAQAPKAALHPASKLLDRFAMHVIVLMMLRGVIEIGEGRRERGDWYDLTDLWLDREAADQWISRSYNRPAGRRAILEAYTTGIHTWKIWWDALPPLDSQAKPLMTRPFLCEDALPIFWLVQALLGVLASSTPVEVRRAFITRINFAEMLNSARALTRENKDATAITTQGGLGKGGPIST